MTADNYSRLEWRGDDGNTYFTTQFERCGNYYIAYVGEGVLFLLKERCDLR